MDEEIQQSAVCGRLSLPSACDEGNQTPKCQRNISSKGDIEILGVLPGHEKAEVVEFLRTLPPRLLQTVETVCCDLWDAYPEAVRQEIPTARIVVDRFHVAKHYRPAAEQVRKQELQRLKQELSKTEYQQLNGSFRAFRTPALAGGARENAKDLNKEERKILRRFFQQSALAKQAYALREQLTALFDMNLSQKQAQAKILRWNPASSKKWLALF
jgi:transposase